MPNVSRAAALLLSFALTSLAVAQVPTQPAVPRFGNGAALENQLFGDVLRIGDGKDKQPLFKLNVVLVAAQYMIAGQYAQALRVCEYLVHVSATREELQEAHLCRRSALWNLGRYSEAEAVAADVELLPPDASVPMAIPHARLIELQWLGLLNVHQGNTAAAERIFSKIVSDVPAVRDAIKSRPLPPDVDPAFWSQLNEALLDTTAQIEINALSALAGIAYYRQDLDAYQDRADALLALPALKDSSWGLFAIEHAERLNRLGYRDRAQELARRSIRLLKANAGFRDQPEPLTQFEVHPAISGALGDETTQTKHVEAWLKLASAYSILDRDTESRALLAGAAVIARRYLLEPESAATLLASVEEAQSDLAAKSRDWRDAIALLRSARSRLENAQVIERTTERGRRGVAAGNALLRVNAKLLTALVETGIAQASGGPALDELASIVSEFSASRAALSALLASRAGTSPAEQAVLARENQLIDELVDLRGLLSSGATVENSNDKRQALARLAAIYDELSRSKGIHEDSSQGIPASQFAALLGPHAAYWQWVGHPNGNFVVCWTSSGLSVARLDAPLAKIREAVRSLQANVDLRNVVSRRQLRPYPKERAQELYRDLFGSMDAKATDARSWLVAMSPEVDGVPWAALWIGRGLGPAPSGSWLIERADLTVVPSWRSWMALRSRPTAAGAMKLLAVGDPVMPAMPADLADDIRVRGAYVAKALELPPVSLHEDSAFSQELRSAAALFPSHQTLLLSRSQATKAQLGALRLSDFNMLLFSTHGYLGQTFSMTIGPSLAMTGSGPSASRYLSAREVARFQLDADLVILSACDTSGSDGFESSEGFSGLTSAFLVAGARNVIATLWPVETETTKDVIISTLRFQVREGDGTARALQRAVIDVIHSGEKWRQHPAFWAPFILVGR